VGERGTLRVYLGAAPGVGKTFAMLDEGRRRRERGTDVVVGVVETHGRPHTQAAVGDLEVLPRLIVDHRDRAFTEMDLDGLLARGPEVALVDELAHTNVPGSRNAKRWQDVEELLAAGVEVITTVNIQHLESLNDVVRQITGVLQRETVPDTVVRAAQQIELVDMSPESLRRRLAHGNVYAAGKIDAALANYFREGNLAALRELALLWVADRVDEAMQRYRGAHEIDGTWAARERVVVAVTGGLESESLIRRASRISARINGGELMAVHVTSSDGLRDSSAERAPLLRDLVEKLGGTWHSVVGDDIPEALLEFARAENATQLVLGVSRHGRFSTFLSGSGVGQTVTRESGDIDVHMVSHDQAAHSPALPALTGGLTARRRVAGAVLALLLLPALTAGLLTLDSTLNLTSEVLIYLAAVVGISIVGGLWPALGAAVLGSLLLNYYFTDPVGTFTIAERNNVIALVVFLGVATAVSVLVDQTARRARAASRARAEAETLSALAGSVLRGENALSALVERVRETFGLTDVSLLQADSGGGWRTLACAGPNPCVRASEADSEAPVGTDTLLALRGRPLRAADRRVLTAFAAQAAVILDRAELAREAQQAGPLVEADRARTALLNAVSHDLRGPLASATAAVSSLRSTDVSWTGDQREELLSTAEESLEQLSSLVVNLLDMSRVNAGAISASLSPVGWDEVVPKALQELGPQSAAVELEGLAEAPLVLADPVLLERIVVNLVANALRHSGTDQVWVTASTIDERVELRVVDRGTGIGPEDREAVFAPFQRRGDTDTVHGVGLGLALSRGLAEAMGGTLVVEDTPGGGVTMVVALPRATPRRPDEEEVA
jgi:two-component system sensor histidine kinase KdpD